MVTMVDDKTTGYTLGATEYLTKPVDRSRLLNAIKRHRCDSPPCRLLLVDDDPDTRSIMARVLSRAGWTVTEAGDGQDALTAMADGRPDLILLDLMMPVMNGFDFIAEMRTQSHWRDVPVIVVTAKDLTAEDRQLLSGKVEQVLTKGAYTRDQLIELVRATVDRVGRTEVAS